MNTTFTHPFGQLTLHRHPFNPDSKAQQNLQAWDAADSLILEEVAKLELGRSAKILILNDQFGALAAALSHLNPQIQTDSFVSRVAIGKNFNLNGIALDEDAILDSVRNLGATYTHVIVRIPKSLNFLEHQLYSLRDAITDDTKIIAGAMVKSLSKNTLPLFERLLGPSHTSLAKKKARLLFCCPQKNFWQGASKFPSQFEIEGKPFVNHANVFSLDKLDMGTRVFLNELHQIPQANSLIDLACGNGVMGIFVAPHANAKHLYFCDESFMAIHSTKLNTQALLADKLKESITCEVADGIPDSFPQVDLIICNPPFHQQNTLCEETAENMFRDAKKHLLPGGVLCVIANRHLNYHHRLKKIFGNCRNLADHKKFVLLRSQVLK